MTRFGSMLGLAALVLAVWTAEPAAATEAGWALLREGGHVVLIRHALTSGTGDPPGVDIENCATQRTLSDRGKLQARKLGALFAARAAPVDRVLSSRYCRCLDTARFAFGEAAEPEAALDPLPMDEAARKAQLEAMRALFSGFSGSGNMVLVTHGENIEALTGRAPREGEALIVRPDGEKVQVIGRIIVN
jgi:broad specificity phosphatase PhoE